MDKKIGILTFHYANNHGAVLQAYALRKVINSFSDCRAEIINYVPEGYGYPVPSGNRVAGMQKKREKFNCFLSEHCGINTPMCHSVTGNEYDVYVVGSDQVWNRDLPENVENEYFFPNLDDNAKRVAYSASIGMDIEKIDKELFRKYLAKFDRISLREKSYVDIISDLSGIKCDATLDPTMLLGAEYYDALIETPEMVKKPYVLYFGYDQGDSGLGSVEMVNTIARKYDLSIKHTFSPEMFLGKKLLVNDEGSMLGDGIGQFLWYIKNAEVIVTNSFHGAVFSILFKRPFYIDYPVIRSCRQKNLVDLLHLQDRVVSGYMSADKMTLDIDYKPIFAALEQERSTSIAYLKNAIALAEKGE